MICKKSMILSSFVLLLLLLIPIPVFAEEQNGNRTEISESKTDSENSDEKTKNGSFFGEVNWSDKLVDFIITVFQSVLIAAISIMILDKAFSSSRSVGRRLRKQGIVKVTDSGYMNTFEINKVFGLHSNSPYQLWLFFLTGREFFDHFEREMGYISQLAEKGCEIRILLCNPDHCSTASLWTCPDYSETMPKTVPCSVKNYYMDILKNKKQFGSFLERQFALNNSDSCTSSIEDTGDYYYEIKHVQELLRKTVHNLSYNRNKISLRLYEDEFRSSLLLAKFLDVETYEFAHTTLNAPVRIATNSISITMEKADGEQAVYLDDLEGTFSYLWDMYASTEVTLYP